MLNCHLLEDEEQEYTFDKNQKTKKDLFYNWYSENGYWIDLWRRRNKIKRMSFFIRTNVGENFKIFNVTS